MTTNTDAKLTLSGENRTKRAFDEIKTSMREVAQSGAALKTALASLGVGLAVGGVVSLVRDSIAEIAALDDFSEATGASVEQVSRLAQVAKISGVQLKDVETSIIKLNKALAGTGGDEEQKGAGAALKALGLSVEELRSQDPAQALQNIANAFNEFSDSGSKSAAAVAIFGKSGAQHLPFIKDLATETGIVARVTAEQAAAAEEAQKSFKRWQNVSAGLTTQLVNDLVPSINAIGVAMLESRKAGDSFFGSVVSGAQQAFREIFRLNTAGDLNRISQDIEKQAEKILRLESIRDRGRNGAGVMAAKRVEEARAQLKVLTDQRDKLEKIFTLETKGFNLTPDAPKKKLDFKEAKPGSKGDGGFEDSLRRLLDERSKIELDAFKSLGQRREAVLDAYYRDNLVSEQDYWSKKLGIAKDASDEELRVLSEQLQRQQAVLAKAAPNSKERNDAQREIEATESRRNKLQQDFAQLATLTYFQAQKAADDYRKEVEQLNIQLLELNGNSAEAATRRAAIATQPLLDKARINGDTDTVRNIERLNELTRAQAEFNEAREQHSLTLARLQLDEERLQNTLRTGAIGEITALNRTSDLRRAAVGELEAEVSALERVAAASGNKKLILEADQARAALEKLRGETDLLADKFNTVFADSASSAFADFISGTKSAKDAFKSFADAVLRDINNIVAKNLAAELFGGKSGGGIGGILSGLFTPAGQGIANTNQSLDSYDPPSRGSGIVGGLFSLFSGLFRADGGPVDGGRPYIVGERGPELYIPRASGTIVPAGQFGGAAQNVSISIVQNFSGAVDRRTSMQAAADAGQQVRRALARNT